MLIIMTFSVMCEIDIWNDINNFQNSSINLSYKYFYTPDNPYPFPSFGAVLQNSKLSVTINSQGEIGSRIGDPFSDEYIEGLKFPRNSKISYLNIASIWVGGIVENDTITSTGYSEAYYDAGNYYAYRQIRELYPTNAYSDNSSINFNKIDDNTISFLSDYVDTFQNDLSFISLNDINYEKKTLNISISQKSYIRNINPYKNIVLLDYTITNIGDKTINDTYVGIYLDADIYGSISAGSINPNPTNDYNDEIAGSFREISTGYMHDNDGYPDSNGYFNEKSPLDGIAIRHIETYPAVTDTNFNWWDNHFGPRLKGTANDPFYNYSMGTLSYPNFDIDKYYILSHPEWDYDQVFISSYYLTDTSWLEPDPEKAEDISKGASTQMLLSVGPIDLEPDSSIRTIFALFLGEYVHTDPQNYLNLNNQNYQTYYDNLFFDILKDNAQKSQIFSSEITNPLLPPLGLEMDYFNNDTVKLAWSEWVFPEVTSYKIQLKKIPDSMLFNNYLPVVNIDFDALDGEIISYTTADNNVTITGLDSRQLYYAVVSNIVGNDESRISNPIIIGADYEDLLIEAVNTLQKFTPVYHDSSSLTFSWEPSLDSTVSYYKIYKTADSSLAQNRYYPFINYDSNLENYELQECRQINSVEHCFYAMTQYDSVLAEILEYTDLNPVANCYYWISSVSEYNIESDYSNVIKSEAAMMPEEKILVILGSSNEQDDFILRDSLINYYKYILKGYEYEIYNWYDTNFNQPNCYSEFCVDEKEISKYKLIIIEEFASPRIIYDGHKKTQTLFSKLIDFNRDIVYFGMPSGPYIIDFISEVEELNYDTNSFIYQYMDLKGSYYRPWKKSYNVYNTTDYKAGFRNAKPIKDGWPNLDVNGYSKYYFKNYINILFNINNYIPLTPAYLPGDKSEVLYTYSSNYPQTSELQGLPCGILNKKGLAKFYSFSFHLWGIQHKQARELISLIVENIGVENNRPSILPDNVEIAQNYPNPFNPFTIISFELPRQSKVTLEIFNVLGQKVITLINAEDRPSGRHEIKWTGRDNYGYKAASGIYFFRLTAGDKVYSKKMMLIK